MKHLKEMTLDGNTFYYKDTKLKDQLNKALCANIVMVWSKNIDGKTKGEINIGGGTFLALLPDGSITEMRSSEWCKIKY